MQAEDYVYETNNGTITTTRYTGRGGDVVIPSTINGLPVTSIGFFAFYDCTSLINITIPDSVISIGNWAFTHCSRLEEVCFQGDAPSLGSDLFKFPNPATVYYLPGTTGLETANCGCPTAPWVLPYPVILTTAPNFGIQPNQFVFRISWATNVSVVVEASARLGSSVWLPLSSNTLADGWSYFSDTEWTNYPARFYRIRGP